MNTRADVASCQRRLAAIWFIGFGLLIIILLGQSLGDLYGTNVKEAWGWLMPLILPIMMLIVGAIAAAAKNPPNSATVDRFAYQLCIGLSLFYLLFILFTITAHIFTRMTPLETIRLSSLWLAPIQGVVGLALGIFFQSKQS